MARKKKTEDVAAAPEKPALPPITPGDTVAVNVKIIEGEKQRTQVFQGTVIKIRGAGENRSFTVRKVSRGFGIERIFPFNSPAVEGVEVKRHSRVRRAKLYYLRERTGRSAQLRERKVERQPGQETVES